MMPQWRGLGHTLRAFYSFGITSVLAFPKIRALVNQTLLKGVALQRTHQVSATQLIVYRCRTNARGGAGGVPLLGLYSYNLPRDRLYNNSVIKQLRTLERVSAASLLTA